MLIVKKIRRSGTTLYLAVSTRGIQLILNNSRNCEADGITLNEEDAKSLTNSIKYSLGLDEGEDEVFEVSNETQGLVIYGSFQARNNEDEWVDFSITFDRSTDVKPVYTKFSLSLRTREVEQIRNILESYWK